MRQTREPSEKNIQTRRKPCFFYAHRQSLGKQNKGSLLSCLCCLPASLSGYGVQLLNRPWRMGGEVFAA